MGWLELLGAVVGTGVLTTVANRLFDRRKTAAEGKQLDAEAEVTLSEGLTEGYGTFVAELQNERAELRKERAEEREELRQERAEMREELREAHRDNLALRLEIGELRTELREVKSDLVRVTAGLPPLKDWSARP